MCRTAYSPTKVEVAEMSHFNDKSCEIAVGKNHVISRSLNKKKINNYVMIGDCMGYGSRKGDLTAILAKKKKVLKFNSLFINPQIAPKIHMKTISH